MIASYYLLLMFMTPWAAKFVTAKRSRRRNVFASCVSMDVVYCFVLALTMSIEEEYSIFPHTPALRTLRLNTLTGGFTAVYLINSFRLHQVNHTMIPLIETLSAVLDMFVPFTGMLISDKSSKFLFIVMGVVAVTVIHKIAKRVSLKNTKDDDKDSSSNSISPREIWSFPMFVNVVCVVNAFIIVAFVETTAMQQPESGLFGYTMSMVYAFTRVFYICVSKAISDARHVCLLNGVVVLFGLVLLMLLPVEFRNCAEILLGFGLGPTYVCLYLHSFKDVRGGTKSPLAALSAIFYPASYAGCIIGSLLAYLFLDYTIYGIMFVLLQHMLTLSLLTATVYLSCARRPEIEMESVEYKMLYDWP